MPLDPPSPTQSRPPALVLTRRDIASLLTPAECLAAVEEAFRQHGAGKAPAPGILGYHVEAGGFHLKVACYTGGEGTLFVAKTNANFPANPTERNLPTVQGVIQVFDAVSGVVLAIMDSIEITILRTAAATAVAAKYLARTDASVLTIAGCGVQGRAHIRALSEVREIGRILLWDTDRVAADRLATELSATGHPGVEVLDELVEGTRASDMIVTCTPSTHYLLGPEGVPSGSFVAGVGADAEHKRELDPRLLGSSRVVVDVLDQCATIGDLHHALAAGAIRRDQIHGELGEVVAGRVPGRTAGDQTFIFDSTGMALQDAAAAEVVLARARRRGSGIPIDIGAQGIPSPSGATP